MKRSRLRVSDHAVLRYLERVGGFDIERLRREIARRACGVVVDGWSFRSKDDPQGPVVTTVIEAHWGRGSDPAGEGARVPAGDGDDPA